MSPDLVHAGSTALTFMLDAALRSLILACFLAVVLELFRVRVVRAELFAWRGLLFVALAMPLLMWLSPAVPLAVPVPSFARDAAAASVQAAQPAPAIEVAPMRALEFQHAGDQPASRRTRPRNGRPGPADRRNGAPGSAAVERLFGADAPAIRKRHRQRRGQAGVTSERRG